jgi:hypothetical protein
MNGPRRLRESGGVTERLLDSASIDKPSRASRARAVELASTAGAFVTTAAGANAVAAARAGGAMTGSSLYKSVAMWICIGAISGGSIAVIGSELLAPGTSPSTQSGARAPATPLVVPEPAIPAPVAPSREPEQDIKPEPVPAKAPPAVASLRAVPSAAPSASPSAQPEMQAIEAAREAVARGDSSGALRTLDNYDATHPNGALQEESAALRVQAVSKTGNSAKARKLASDFEKKYPTSPLRGVVREATRAE